MALNLAMILESSAQRYPTNTAIIFNDFKLDYRTLRASALRFASALQNLGVTRGEKVALLIPNLPQFTIAYFGTLYAGATIVPLNVLSVADEVQYHIDDSDAVVLVAFEGFLEAAAKGAARSETCKHLIVIQAPGSTTPLPPGAHSFQKLLAEASTDVDMVQTSPDDTAVILYTSGTTGRPKGAELTHCNLFMNAQFANEKLIGTMEKPNYVAAPHVAIACLPLFHSFGQTVIQNGMLFHGAAITLLPRFTPDDCMKILHRDHVSIFAGVPTMYFALLHHPDFAKYDIRLQYCLSGGAPIPVEVMKAFDAKFNVNIQEGFGLSETSPVACFNTLDFPKKAGSIGKPILGVQMKIADDQDQEVARGERGEVVIRGHNIMKGYYKRPEATLEAMKNTWFHTGDIGIQDEEGYFFIVDRKKDMIIRGGFNVYPREVEEVLYAHPAVMEAAVIGIPHDEYGEEVKAVIALKPGHAATPDELRAYCKEHLAAYKYPRVITLVEALPKGPTGKILKRELRS
jgi:long-chain acyl-CoA synthetase